MFLIQYFMIICFVDLILTIRVHHDMLKDRHWLVLADTLSCPYTADVRSKKRRKTIQERSWSTHTQGLTNLPP
jgi:hypothetical protein